MQSTSSINLIKSRASTLDEILRWTLGIGRFLIIITEIVALTMLLYRFILDRTLIDLNEKIIQEQKVITSLKEKEAVYRDLQGRIMDVSRITISGGRNVKILNDVTKLTPPEITFNSFAIENNQIAIDSQIQSIASLTNFLALLRDYPEISSVSVERIDNNSLSNSINVLIKVTLKEEKK